MAADTEKTRRVVSELDVEIGRRVHELMWDLKMTQAAFCAQINLSSSTVAKRVRGYLPWRATHLVDAAAILHTSVAYLVGETDDRGASQRTPEATGTGGVES